MMKCEKCGFELKEVSVIANCKKCGKEFEPVGHHPSVPEQIFCSRRCTLGYNSSKYYRRKREKVLSKS